MDERKQDVLDVLARLGQATLEDVSAAVGLPESNTLSRLQNMTKEGQVKQVEMEGQIFYRL